ncbi:hypothetical protein GC175_18455 [bacterium]|nr:hypothetical protein [bacterium]
MLFIPPFVIGVVVGFFLKQGYEVWQRRNGVTANMASNEATAPVLIKAEPDSLEAIHGIGPVFARRLREEGIEYFEQLAQLTPERIHAIIAPIRSSHMIDAERWIDEARTFAEKREQVRVSL